MYVGGNGNVNWNLNAFHVEAEETIPANEKDLSFPDVTTKVEGVSQETKVFSQENTHVIPSLKRSASENASNETVKKIKKDQESMEERFLVHLTDLPNDVIIHIFRSNFRVAVNLSKTCKAFHNLINPHWIADFINKGNVTWNAKAFLGWIKLNGQSIKNLDFNRLCRGLHYNRGPIEQQIESVLPYCKNLEEFTLPNVPVTEGILDKLKNLKSVNSISLLKDLPNLGANHLLFPDHLFLDNPDQFEKLIGKLPKLKHLALTFTASLNSSPIVERVLSAAVRPLSILHSLDISGADFTNLDLAQLEESVIQRSINSGEKNSLKEINLHNCQIAPGQLPSLFQIFSELGKLKLQVNQIEIADFLAIKSDNLESLDLSGYNLSDDFFESLQRFPNLKELYLRDSKDIEWNAFFENVPKSIQKLDVSGCVLPANFFEKLGLFKNLKCLYLENVNIRDTDGARIFDNNPNLLNLKLNSPSVTAAFFAGSKNALEKLTLYYCDEIYNSIDDLNGLMPALKRLDIFNTESLDLNAVTRFIKSCSEMKELFISDAIHNRQLEGFIDCSMIDCKVTFIADELEKRMEKPRSQLKRARRL